MAKVLMRTTEIWRVDTEAEAQEVITDALSTGGELTKKIVEVKQRKSKGQVIDENLKVTTQVDYADQFGSDGDEE